MPRKDNTGPIFGGNKGLYYTHLPEMTSKRTNKVKFLCD